MARHYGWVIVAVGALMTCVSIGAMFSLAVFLQPISEATGWARAGISSAMTINFLTMGLGGFLWGALSDRFGARSVVLIGSVLLGAGLTLASRAGSLLEFQLVYGVLVGLGAGAFFTPMIATTTAWFDKNRGLAVSLVSAGVAVAPMTISPFASWLVADYGWRSAQLTIGIGAWLLLIPASLLVRRAPSAMAEPVPGAAGLNAPGTGAPAPGLSRAALVKAFRSPQFIVLALTFFACCATHSGPIFHTISYAIACGIAPLTAVTIYSAEGLAGLGGRLLLGLLADRFGAKPILIGGLAVQALAAGSYYFADGLTSFYVVAVIFGMAYGGVMPLYAVLAREYFGPHIMGTVFGAAAMISSLGMALGPAVGGWIFDTYGSYAWLYIGAFAIGVGAAAMALAFPPLPSRRSSGLQPA